METQVSWEVAGWMLQQMQQAWKKQRYTKLETLEWRHLNEINDHQIIDLTPNTIETLYETWLWKKERDAVNQALTTPKKEFTKVTEPRRRQ